MTSIIAFRPFNNWLVFYTALYSFSTLSTVFCIFLIVWRMRKMKDSASGQLFFGALFVASLIPFHIIHGTVIILKKTIVLPTGACVQSGVPGSASIVFGSVNSALLLTNQFDAYIVTILILFCDNIELTCISNCIVTGMFFFMNLAVGIRAGVRPYPSWLTNVIHDKRAVLACVAVNLAVLVVTFAIDRYAYLPIYALNATLEIISLLILIIFMWAVSITINEMRHIAKQDLRVHPRSLSSPKKQKLSSSSSSPTRAYYALVRILITAIALFIIMGFALYSKYISNFLADKPFPFALEASDPAGLNFSFLLFAVPGPSMILVFYNRGNNGGSNGAGSMNSRLKTSSLHDKHEIQNANNLAQ